MHRRCRVTFRTIATHRFATVAASPAGTNVSAIKINRYVVGRGRINDAKAGIVQVDAVAEKCDHVV